jgi:hypothetical protein
MSAQCVTLVVRSLCLSSPFAPSLGCLWPVSSCYSLERVCYGIFCFPVLPLPTFTPHIDAACDQLRWSIHATWIPHCHLRLWAATTMFFVFVRYLISAFVTLPFHTTNSIYIYIYIYIYICMYIYVCVCLYCITRWPHTWFYLIAL